MKFESPCTDPTNARTAGLLAVVALAAVSPLLAETADDAQQATPGRVISGAEHGPPVTPFVFRGDVRDLPRPQKWQPGDPVKEIPRRQYVDPSGAPVQPYYQTRRDPLLDVQAAAAAASSSRSFDASTRNFPGQGYTGVNPPDTVGDVGPDHYIQMINGGGGSVVRIWDKALPNPNELATFSLDSLGSGVCASGAGDPIVLYDRLADRWMLSEFSGSGANLCVYVSQTGDPVGGGWYFYGFGAPSFPDYPKYGVWPTDANAGAGSYTVTANDGGPGVYALDRGAMLVGDPATFQRLTVPGLPGFGFESPTPADLDGPNAPPSTRPAVIMRHRDTENHSGPAAPGDLLELWEFDVDWVTPSNTTLTQQASIDVSEFDSDLCGLSSFFCFPQPSGPTLDPLREVIMNRLQYMNNGDYESLVGNLVTDVDGTDHGGIRWFELRRVAATWTLEQEGTYSIDADHRWMGASSMDQSGNIALGYSVSSTSTFPSLRYTGRLSSDPPGAMTQGEHSIHEGTASNGSNRWGDYAAMNLDPSDDCTFWFTSLDNESSGWRTQIASFRFEACGCLLQPSPLLATAQDLGGNQVEIDWNDADLDTVIEYRVERSRTPGGPYETIATIADSSPGVADGLGYFYVDNDVSGGTTYYYRVRAGDGLACLSDSNEASATATGACTLPPDFDGLQFVSTQYSNSCALDLFWNAGSDNCGAGLTYNVYRAPTPGFTPDATKRIASGVLATTYGDSDQLVSGTTYYYIVRAVDNLTGVEEQNSIELSGVPQGPLSPGTWTDDAGDTGPALLQADTPWAINDTEGNLGPRVYKTGDYGDLTCGALTTPQLKLGAGAELTFSARYDIEDSWDKGEVQISVDGGATWSRLDLAYPGTSTNASDSCGLPTGTYFTGTDLTWTTYTADLSAWDGQFVELRFLMSSDTAVTASGWWIDDLGITSVDVPGECQTASACPDNPFVDVTPDGPLDVCVFDIPRLTALTSGGTAPFVYQWTKDGVDIPGATGAAHQPASLGSYAYNVRVRSELCGDDVSDGFDTTIAAADTPQFSGIVSATNAQGSSCSVDVAWNAGSSICPGPVRYFVYRDVSSPVNVAPENLVASGVPGTSYTDSSGLVDGSTYHYLVRAQDATTGLSDGNTLEAAAVPDGPGSGLQAVLDEDFESPEALATWTVTTGPGIHNCGDWATDNGATKRPAGGSGSYGIADNQCGLLLNRTSTTLTSPTVDLDLTDLNGVTLEYDLFFNYNGGETGRVEVWDGGQWVTLWTSGTSDLNAHQVFDVTAHAAGNPAFQVRFDYQDATQAQWFSVDNVRVITDRLVTCETALAVASAPDGSAGTSPLTGDRVDPAGAAIQTAWDASSCPASDYNLIYGDLANVAAYTIDGSACSLGASGSYTWNAVPAGDLFFVVVGTDGTGTESAWGRDGFGGERNFAGASGECATTIKDASNVCP